MNINKKLRKANKKIDSLKWEIDCGIASAFNIRSDRTHNEYPMNTLDEELHLLNLYIKRQKEVIRKLTNQDY